MESHSLTTPLAPARSRDASAAKAISAEWPRSRPKNCAGRNGGGHRGRYSRRFAPPLDGLQLLAVFLRIASDFALGQAVDPQVVRNVAAFTASADDTPILEIGGTLLGRSLLPAAARSYVENPDVAIHQ